MSTAHTAAALSNAFAARFPNAHSTTLESLSASADTGGRVNLGFCTYDPAAALESLQASAEEPVVLESLQAMGVRGFASVSGKLQWVRTTQHIHINFEFIPEGDFVQVPDEDAKRLVAAGRAELATDDDVAAAQKSTKGSK